MQEQDLTGIEVYKIGEMGNLAEVEHAVVTLLAFMNGFHHFEVVVCQSSRVPDNAESQEHPMLAIIVCEDENDRLPVACA